MTQTLLRLQNVDVEFTIYGAQSRSLRTQTVKATTGGLISFPTSSRASVAALSNLSFEIRHGERVGLVGHNGAGKTTLLRVLAGVFEPVRGTIERRGRMSPLFDLSSGFMADATGWENILIRGMHLGLARRDLIAQQEEIAAFTGLGDYLDMPVHTYSAGMQMRLAFAISTAITPEILLMDEWLAVGDAGFVEKAEDRLLALVGGTGILVIASHSLPILERLCSRLIWLDNGRLVVDGPCGAVAALFKSVKGDASKLDPGAVAASA